MHRFVCILAAIIASGSAKSLLSQMVSVNLLLKWLFIKLKFFKVKKLYLL